MDVGVIEGAVVEVTPVVGVSVEVGGAACVGVSVGGRVAPVVGVKVGLAAMGLGVTVTVAGAQPARVRPMMMSKVIFFIQNFFKTLARLTSIFDESKILPFKEKLPGAYLPDGFFITDHPVLICALKRKQLSAAG